VTLKVVWHISAMPAAFWRKRIQEDPNATPEEGLDFHHISVCSPIETHV
jgi:hypothetical protein